MEGMNVPVQPVDPQRRSDTMRRVCLISLGGELYAVDLRNVREVFEVESVTPVPGMPAALVGVANLRGVVIPLVDLRFLLGVPVNGPSPPFAVVVRHGSRQVGVLVERVPEIRNLRNDQFLPAVQTAGAESRPFVSTVLRIEDRLGGMLEVPMVFEHVEGGQSIVQTA
jgi:purine-binding chemotaxis protein CheW